MVVPKGLLHHRFYLRKWRQTDGAPARRFLGKGSLPVFASHSALGPPITKPMLHASSPSKRSSENTQLLGKLDAHRPAGSGKDVAASGERNVPAQRAPRRISPNIGANRENRKPATREKPAPGSTRATAAITPVLGAYALQNAPQRRFPADLFSKSERNSSGGPVAVACIALELSAGPMTCCAPRRDREASALRIISNPGRQIKRAIPEAMGRGQLRCGSSRPVGALMRVRCPSLITAITNPCLIELSPNWSKARR